MHNDGADDHSVSREYILGRHRVNTTLFVIPLGKFLFGFNRSIQLSVPEVKSTVVNIEGFKVPSDVNKVTQLAYFLRETLHLGASALHQLVMQVCTFVHHV